MKITGSLPITFKSNDNLNSQNSPNDTSLKYDKKLLDSEYLDKFIRDKLNPVNSVKTHFSNKKNNKKDDYLTAKGYKNAEIGLLISTLIAPLSFAFFNMKHSKNIKDPKLNILLSLAIGIIAGIAYSFCSSSNMAIREYLDVRYDYKRNNNVYSTTKQKNMDMSYQLSNTIINTYPNDKLTTIFPVFLIKHFGNKINNKKDGVITEKAYDLFKKTMLYTGLPLSLALSIYKSKGGKNFEFISKKFLKNLSGYTSISAMLIGMYVYLISKLFRWNLIGSELKNTLNERLSD